MITKAEKRAYGRNSFSADVLFSYFNREHSYSAQIMNLGTGGMCLKSSFSLQTGATVYIRLKKIHPNDSGTGSCEGLRSVTLAEVKWCIELPGAKALSYGVGVKYFEAAY